jgi:hypothetical protein
VFQRTAEHVDHMCFGVKQRVEHVLLSTLCVSHRRTDARNAEYNPKVSLPNFVHVCLV